MRLLFALFLIICFSSYGQKPIFDDIFSGQNTGDRQSETRLLVDYNWETWDKSPSEVELGYFSFGVNVHLMKDFPFSEKSNFSVGIGVGLSSHSVHSNSGIVVQTNLKTNEEFTALIPYGKNYTYYKNKLATNYIDLPLEFRFKTKGNKPFRLSIGGKFGVLVNGHTKVRDENGKRKNYTLNNINPYRYGIQFRTGIGRFNLHGFYSLSSLFLPNKGTIIYPYSIGVSLVPF